jgi:hypothetical protein
MSKLSVFLIILLLLFTIAHLVISIDYNHLFTVGNKGGATGVMVGILGIISVLLAQKTEKKGQSNI